jgi:hypothetical protein
MPHFVPAIGSRILYGYPVGKKARPYIIIGYKDNNIAVIQDVETGKEDYIIMFFYKYRVWLSGYEIEWNPNILVLG